MRGSDPRSGDDEVASGFDVDDEVVRRDLAHRPDLLAAFFQEQLITDGYVERHTCTLPLSVQRALRIVTTCGDGAGAAASRARAPTRRGSRRRSDRRRSTHRRLRPP